MDKQSLDYHPNLHIESILAPFSILFELICKRSEPGMTRDFLILKCSCDYFLISKRFLLKLFLQDSYSDEM